MSEDNVIPIIGQRCIVTYDGSHRLGIVADFEMYFDTKTTKTILVRVPTLRKRVGHMSSFIFVNLVFDADAVELIDPRCRCHAKL